MRKISILIGCGLLFSCASSPGEKEDGKFDSPVIKVDPESKAESISDGATLFITCIACHGQYGEGNSELGAPALVNQSVWYLERQLKNFKNGIRGTDPADLQGVQMAAIAKTLKSEAEIVGVVSYIKTLKKVKTKQTIDGDIEAGKQFYSMICGACHGSSANGNQALNAPKLVGIDDWYLFSQYQKFEKYLRGSHPDDTFGSQMQMMSASLPDEKALRDVISYIKSQEK